MEIRFGRKWPGMIWQWTLWRQQFVRRVSPRSERCNTTWKKAVFGEDHPPVDAKLGNRMMRYRGDVHGNGQSTLVPGYGNRLADKGFAVLRVFDFIRENEIEFTFVSRPSGGRSNDDSGNNADMLCQSLFRFF